MKNILIACILIFASATARGEANNLLKNPSLDGGPLPYEWNLADTGEQLPGELAQDSDAGQNGESSLRITHPPGGGHYTQVRQAVVVTPKAHYVLSARVKTENLASKGTEAVPALIGLYTKEGNTIAAERVDTMGEWTDVELEFQIPDGIENAQFLIYFDAAEGAYWVEQVSLTLAEDEK